MLFTPEKEVSIRREIVDAVESQKLSMEAAAERILALDPEDPVALTALGNERMSAGDAAAAEAFFWRGVNAAPWMGDIWFALRGALQERDDGDLKNAVLELAAALTLKDPEAVERFEERFEGSRAKFDGIAATGADFLVETAHVHFEVRRDEPAEVSERMLPYRLIEEFLDAAYAGMEGELVDEIVAQGPRVAPLLIAVLRGIVRGILEDEDSAAGAAAIALLGEIADPAHVPELLECYLLEDEPLDTAAQWALQRTAELKQEETFAVLQRIAPGADASTRRGIAFTLEKLLAQPGQHELLLSLLEGMEAFEKDDRKELFLGVAETLQLSNPAKGKDEAWSLLKKYGALLPRRTKQELIDIQKFLEAIQEILENPASPAPRTVYDFCGGLSDDDGGDDDEGLQDVEEEEFEDDDDLIPQPIHRHETPGRNDPCWCGSGKKYKKCHLDADQAAHVESARGPAASPKDDKEARLRRRLIEFATNTLSKREMEEAMLTFLGPNPDGQDDQSMSMEVVDWLIHDYVSKRTGRTMTEEFLRRAPGGLGGDDRRMVEAWGRSHFSIYEVQDVRVGEGAGLRDLLAGGDLFVSDVNTSRQAQRWDCFLARVEDISGRKNLTAVVTDVPRPNVAGLIEWAKTERERSGQDWDVFLRQSSHRLRQKAWEMLRAAPEPRIVSAEGDALMFSRSVYDILDHEALRQALNASQEMDESRDGYTWLEPGELESGGRRVLGQVRIAGERLTLECQTGERLERGKEMLQQLAGTALRHKGDELTSVKRAMDDARKSGRPAKKPEVTQEMRDVLVQISTEHYRTWPDHELPALGGLTPRKAMETAEGRAQVVELLKTIENHELHKRADGEVWFDVAELRRALAVEY